MPAKNEFEYKPWLKLWSHNWLSGSIRFDCNAEQRSVFVDLLCMANESRNRGIIQANKSTAYPHTWLASTLNIPLDMLEESLRAFESSGRIKENGNGIEILNFAYYNDILGVKKKKGAKTQEEQDPDKYVKGKFGHVVHR